MDWSDNEELQVIFREEVAERSHNLVEGGNSLADGDLDEGSFNDLSRDGHTIKGNALVMGFPIIADAAKALEFTWKDLRDGRREPDPELGGLLASLADHLVPAIEIEGKDQPTELLTSLNSLRTYLDGGNDDPPPVDLPDDHSTAPSIPPGGSSKTDPPDPAGSASSTTSHPDRFAPGVQMTAAREPVDLGGLLSTIEGRIIGDVTRVDAAKLYELINKSVEVKLDMEALAQGVRGLRMAVATGPGEVSALASTWEGSVERLEQSLDDLQSLAMELATVPLSEVTETFPQLATYLGRRTGKELRFELIGDDIEVDRQIVDALREPLRHLLVNAIDHGIEMPRERADAGKSSTACVTIRAGVQDNKLEITVEDDGRGVDWDRVRDVAEEKSESEVQHSGADLGRFLFTDGFSTVSDHTDLSGDGRGLAAASEMAAGVNGGLRLDTSPGSGTTISLTLPASLALQDVLLIRSGGHRWGIPQVALLESLPIAAADIRPGERRTDLRYEGRTIPISSFASALGLPEAEEPDGVVVLTTRFGLVALTVSQIEGRRQVAVKGLGPLLAGSLHLAGAALLGGGEVVVVVDPDELSDRLRTTPRQTQERPRVLVVDDSRGVRQLIGAALSGQGFDVVVASNTEEALEEVTKVDFDALVVDYQMPGSDGVDLVKQIRVGSRSMPVVMVSAVATPEDQDRAWKAGVDAYLDKFDIRKGVLVDTLRNLLPMRNSGQKERSA